ncbi:purine permease 3 [Setaria italica]|uniref:purine permease 3 n=1 Tax=Setaria italica TaxID=4555 RepID=UPI0003510935|nr:purine permease 3 [Setaria italica]
MVANNSNSVQHTGRAPASPLVTLSACLVLLSAGGSLVIRVYFVHGGPHLWVSTMMQVGGWPLLLPIWASLLLLRDGGGAGISVHLRSPHRAGFLAVFGACFAIACFAYSLGSQSLPLSTSAVLQATQLAFNAIFAFLFAGLRFTPFSVNAVVLLSMGPAVLGARPNWAGFVECLTSAAVLGLVLPLVQVTMSRGHGRRSGAAETAPPPPPSFAMVVQMQVLMGAAATAVCLVGMAVSKTFQAVPEEAGEFGLGETGYYLLLVVGAISWQLSNLGVMALIVCSSSLLAGIMIALFLPLSDVLAVIFLHEKMDGLKAIALVVSLWGFVSYLYGESLEKKMEAGEKEAESICSPLIVPCDF